MIHVSYSYARRSQKTLAAPPEVFHIRQLSYPLAVTVYHMLECQSMDVLPCPSYRSDRLHFAEAQGLRHDNIATDNESSWCIFSIEVRNTYGSPFEVTFQRKQEGTPLVTTSTTVPPGSTSRCHRCHCPSGNTAETKAAGSSFH